MSEKEKLELKKIAIELASKQLIIGESIIERAKEIYNWLCETNNS